MSLTVAQIRCVLAILALTRMEEEVASKNIAKLMGITRPSVHKMLDVLVSKGVLEKEHYGTAKLTERGIELAERLESRKERLLILFSKQFGLSPDESSAAATLLMSGLSEERLNRLECAPIDHR